MFRLSLIAPSRQALATRSFASSSRLLASSRHENNPEVLEKEKKKNIDAVNKGDPNWNEKLASDSEAHIKADKNEKSPSQLQKETAYKAHQHHGEEGHAGTKHDGYPTGSEEAVKADRTEPSKH